MPLSRTPRLRKEWFRLLALPDNFYVSFNTSRLKASARKVAEQTHSFTLQASQSC